MKRFSERMGFKPVKTKLQIDTLGDNLRNRLWNAFEMFYWQKIRQSGMHIDYKDRPFISNIWDFFAKPIDETDEYWWSTTYKKLHENYDELEWYEVYDFLEHIIQISFDVEKNQRLKFQGLKWEKGRSLKR